MKSVQTYLNKFAVNYNILWVLYILFVVFIQAQTLSRDLVKLPVSLPYTVWDIYISIMYIISLGAYVFRKHIFQRNVWKVIFSIVLLNIPLTLLRIFNGDIPLDSQLNCQEVGIICDFTKYSLFFNTILYLLPLYYALMKLVNPRHTIPFVKYPSFTADYNNTPNRLLAIPLIGIFIKIILLIPFFIVQLIVGFVAFFMQIINYFYILFLGRIWKLAFRFTFWSISLQANGSAYIFGLTDKYPSFNEIIEDTRLSIQFHPAQRSNRLLGAPLIGPFLRYVMVLPLNTFASYIYYATGLGIVLSWFVVLFTGKYPRSVYELATDTIRLQSSIALYSTAMSDKYPSFSISLNHPYKKVLLIIFSIMLIYLSSLVAQIFQSQF